ncbi:hypothetical protein ACNKHU_00195 [Shigella flexneri]
MLLDEFLANGSILEIWALKKVDLMAGFFILFCGSCMFYRHEQTKNHLTCSGKRLRSEKIHESKTSGEKSGPNGQNLH